jgi:hypothetical protein
MQNYSAKIKNSTVSHGNCGHGLLYNRRESSSSATGTNRPIFMQNKANFRKSQMDIKLITKRDYDKNSKWTLGENKPNF